MGRVRTGTFLTCVVAWLALGGSAAWAQYNNNNNANPRQQLQARLQQLPVVDLKGTIEKVDSDLINIKCEGQAFLLKVAQDYTRVQCNGTAEQRLSQTGRARAF